MSKLSESFVPLTPSHVPPTQSERVRLAVWHARNLRVNGHYQWRANHAWIMQLAADIRRGTWS